MNRGSPAVGGDLDVHGAPSMRPRFMNRGSADGTEMGDFRTTGLQ